MTRRRKLLLSLLAAVTTAAVLALPGVHWRLYGLARGEPFYDGRPFSFWRQEVAECWVDQANSPPEPGGTRPVLFYRRTDTGLWDGLRFWLGETGGRYAARLKPLARHDYSRHVPLPLRGDPAAVPFLVRLLADTDPKVRAYAAQALGDLRAAPPEAVEALRRARFDEAEVLPLVTVASLSARALQRLGDSTPDPRADPRKAEAP
jgi:hypothetical protein